jgi:hypothetical protein
MAVLATLKPTRRERVVARRFFHYLRTRLIHSSVIYMLPAAHLVLYYSEYTKLGGVHVGKGMLVTPRA